MGRTNLESNRTRGLMIETALVKGVMLSAIAANQVLVTGMPHTLAYDPAATNRNITLYTPAVVALSIEHEIWNIGTGAGVLSILSPAAAVLGSIAAGQMAVVRWINGAWNVFTRGSGTSAETNAAKMVIPLYTSFASLANTNVLAWKAPFAGTLNLIGMRTKAPATTAAKLATLTGQIAGVPVTGGVLSLTSANMTPTNVRVDSTPITALNTFTAGQSVGALLSAVTAFVEGDGYLELDVTNTDLNQ